MSKDAGRMCKWDKDRIKKNFEEFAKCVGDAGHACVKCGRVAATKDQLCKPEKLPKTPQRAS